MICPKCSKDNKPGSRFCASCGAPMSSERTLDAGPPPATAERRPPVAAPPRPTPPAPTGMSAGKKALIGVTAVVILALLGFLGWQLGPWAKAKEDPNTGVLQAEGSQPNTGVLQAQGSNPNTGVLQAEGNPREPVTMPADIENWLKHLERTEQQRVALTKDATSAMMVTMTKLSVSGGADNLERIMAGDDPKPPGDELKAQTNEMRKDWYNLTEFFRSVPPPQRCRQLAQTYDGVLVNTGLSMMAVVEALSKAGQDPQGAISALQQQRGRSRQNIDLPAASADTQVAEICREYNKDKWFIIHTDIGGQFQSIGAGF